MSLTKLTGIDGETILVRLDQIACAYPSDLFGEGDDMQNFSVETVTCTKTSMISGDVLHVAETPEDILKLTSS